MGMGQDLDSELLKKAQGYRAESRVRGAPPLRLGDAGLLSWFHGDGGTVFERSPFGSMLERADMVYGPPGIEGHGGAIVSRDSFAGDTKKAWRADQRERLESEETTKALLEFDPELTARITAETHPTPATPDNERDLERIAEVTSTLRKMDSAGRKGAHLVAAAMYDERGVEWAGHGFEYGGLYHLTATGQRLIRRIREETKKDCAANLRLSDGALLANDLSRAEVFATPENHARREAFDKARGEAVAMFADFASGWNYLRHGAASGVSL